MCFFMVFMVFGAKPCCFPHVFSHKYVFLSVFSMFFDSNLPTPPSVNWKIVWWVLGVWFQKLRKHIINHTCMESSLTK